MYKNWIKFVKNHHRKMVSHSFGRINANACISEKFEAKFSKKLCVGDSKVEKLFKIGISP